MNNPQKLHIAQLPTPIVKLERLSLAAGKNIWLKRDDLTGVELSGNKIRKLEYVFGDVAQKRSDYVITCGGAQSNHCRATAALAARLGVKCLLFLMGEEGESTGNLLLDKLFGAECVFLPMEESEKIMEIMNTACGRLSAKGHRPYVIPMGASNPLGALGYMEAFREIVEYERNNSVYFDTVCLADGSGGTHAGILAGSKKEGGKRCIYGISVLAQAESVANNIVKICEGLDSQYGIGACVSSRDVRVTDRYIAPGYGAASAEVLEFIKETAKTEGIIFDHTYTGKALFGLISEIKRGAIAQSDNILFVHTGGIFGIFGQTSIYNL